MRKNKSKLAGIGLQFFGMKNLDAQQQERKEILQRFADAVKENNTEGFNQAFGDLADSIQQSVLGDFHEMQAQQDVSVLTARGCRVLTSTEQKYYEGVIGAMKSADPKQALTNISKVLPETVIDSVFDDLRADHPLLAAINFQSTGELIKILLSTTGGTAAWGTIDHTITDELSANFLEVNLELAKLTAFLPVNRHMIDLGPAWLDRYVREVLSEALAVQLEVGIVSGTGKNQPIGMQKKLSGAVDGVYPDKATTAITDLGPATFGTLLNTLTTAPNGKRRAVPSVIMLVNPSDYFTKVFPATTPRAADGTYNHDVLPYPCQIIQSPAVSAGKAIFGIASRYFMGLGTQEGGKIEFSDEYKFLEQVRTYAIFLYGYGRALDENAFLYVDISGLKEYALPVEVQNPTLRAEVVNDCRLSSLAIGNLTLSPIFDRDTITYTAVTTNATNTISAVAKDGDSVIEIKNGATVVSNGAAATWATGANIVTVKVTNGGTSKTYTVTVTKS